MYLQSDNKSTEFFIPHAWLSEDNSHQLPILSPAMFEYYVTYHDPRLGADNWENVVAAERISKSEARNAMDSTKLATFKEFHRKVFHQCHEALKPQRAVLLIGIIKYIAAFITLKASKFSPCSFLSNFLSNLSKVTRQFGT
ncbi:hypothetical protein N7456_003301 [Penicillium angulare]|uniref:Uncharacterized protein n=1 Tax=Penicillium angulare TaxID=116970 RepID=A0A9W9FUD5_9EURO|nr:hypothetical protein N7456_003301 [Penicillium angulare]